MADGYYFIIFCWLIFILVWSQWLESLYQNQAKKRKRMLFYLVLILLLQFIDLPVSGQVKINLSVCSMAIFTLIMLWNDRTGFRSQMISVILFLGIFYGVAYELFLLDPILMIIKPTYLLPILFTLFLLITTKSISQQLVMLVGGLILGDLIHHYFMLTHLDHILIGSGVVRDQIALGSIAIIVSQWMIRSAIRLIRWLNKHIQFLRRENQEG